jgi:hypothetical protein
MGILIAMVRQETERKQTLVQHHENINPVTWSKMLGIEKR